MILLLSKQKKRTDREPISRPNSLRGQTVERVNADWKQHRQLRRFSGRGLARVRGEVGLIVLAPNLLALQAEQAKAAVATAKAATPFGGTT